MAPKPPFVVITLLILGHLVHSSSAKCPGFPISPAASAPPDYIGIGLDIAAMVVFGVLGYFLVKRRNQGGG